MRRGWIAGLSILAVLVLMSASCSKDENGGVGVTLADYSVTLDQTTATSGEVTFNVTNDAGQVHEFVVTQTDLADTDLPVDETGDVDEESSDIANIDELEDIQPGTEGTLTVNLQPGNYVLFCNVPGHYRQGMHKTFTVT